MRHMILGIAALLCAGLLAACSDGDGAKISGDITSATPLTLPDGATIEIALLDIEADDPANAEIAETSFETPQTGMPIAYELGYDPEHIERDRIYTLAVRVLVDGEIRFTATHHNATVTGVGNSILDVVIEPVAPLAPRAE